MRAFTKPNGQPKTHRRPRVCEHCRQNIKGACLLPFRLTLKLRWLHKKYNMPYIRKDKQLENMRR